MQSDDDDKDENLRSASSRSVGEVGGGWLQSHVRDEYVDKIISSTSIYIEVGCIKEHDIIGFNVKLDEPVDDGSQPSGHALAPYGGGVPSEPSDNEPDEPDELAEFCDVCKPLWRECVSIAHHNCHFHHKASPRIIRGVPN